MGDGEARLNESCFFIKALESQSGRESLLTLPQGEEGGLKKFIGCVGKAVETAAF